MSRTYVEVARTYRVAGTGVSLDSIAYEHDRLDLAAALIGSVDNDGVRVDLDAAWALAYPGYLRFRKLVDQNSASRNQAVSWLAQLDALIKAA